MNNKDKWEHAHAQLKIWLRCECDGVMYKVTLNIVSEVGRTAS